MRTLGFAAFCWLMCLDLLLCVFVADLLQKPTKQTRGIFIPSQFVDFCLQPFSLFFLSRSLFRILWSSLFGYYRCLNIHRAIYDSVCVLMFGPSCSRTCSFKMNEMRERYSDQREWAKKRDWQKATEPNEIIMYIPEVD